MRIAVKMISLTLLPLAVRGFAAVPRASLHGSRRVASQWRLAPSMLFNLGQLPLPNASGAPVTAKEVRAAQANWANSIAKISDSYLKDGDFKSVAGSAAGELYAYGHANVLFKPTKAKDMQFRPSAADAMSYFVGASNVEDGIAEDGGFAINGGKGWSKVVFDNHQIDLNGPVAIAMGNYYFTCATTGEDSKVEYTFGYKRCDDGKVRIFLHHSSVPFNPDPSVGSSPDAITESEVRAAQANWASSIAKISSAYLNNEDFKSVAGSAAGELYAYGHANVLFKPTKAKDMQFRPMASDAMSYFVGAENVEEGAISEDGGFAINGGKGWSSVVFDNHQIDLNGNTAVAMGNYFFTCASTGEESKVEYTFGYKRCDDGKVRIFLHHSSVPFNPEPAVAADAVDAAQSLSEADVRAAQANWADSIAKISSAYLNNEDFKAVAGEAAGDLYAYGHSNVLFKPTKAKDMQFRPMGADAMSYFVGAQNVEEGAVSEDGGFAINGGKGWSKVVFDNHQIEIKGSTAIAMGNYYFTDATTSDVTKVEYTFGYMRCDDGKVRIFLHHSSVPFDPSPTAATPAAAVPDFIENLDKVKA